MKIFTIGFTKKTARRFFNLLSDANVRRIVDIRLNNVSQLAGFAKRQDLEFFSEKLCGIGYDHLPVLAPTKDILDNYKKHGGTWEDYELKFLQLMEQRRIASTIPKELLADGCLLCSEHEPHHCHRRLVAEYLAGKWDNVQVVHLE